MKRMTLAATLFVGALGTGCGDNEPATSTIEIFDENGEIVTAGKIAIFDETGTLIAEPPYADGKATFSHSGSITVAVEVVSPRTGVVTRVINGVEPGSALQFGRSLPSQPGMVITAPVDSGATGYRLHTACEVLESAEPMFRTTANCVARGNVTVIALAQDANNGEIRRGAQTITTDYGGTIALAGNYRPLSQHVITVAGVPDGRSTLLDVSAGSYEVTQQVSNLPNQVETTAGLASQSGFVAVTIEQSFESFLYVSRPDSLGEEVVIDLTMPHVARQSRMPTIADHQAQFFLTNDGLVPDVAYFKIYTAVGLFEVLGALEDSVVTWPVLPSSWQHQEPRFGFQPQHAEVVQCADGCAAAKQQWFGSYEVVRPPAAMSVHTIGEAAF